MDENVSSLLLIAMAFCKQQWDTVKVCKLSVEYSLLLHQFLHFCSKWVVGVKKLIIGPF